MTRRAKPFVRGILFLASAFSLTLSTLQAQLVADGATSVLSNVTNTVPGNVTVGTNGSFTLLVLSDNCLLTNSGLSTIGANASAKSNEVRLVSSTARWLMGASSGNSLLVGSNGAANRLLISNGATVAVSGPVQVGYISESASNNLVWVTGPNSAWSCTASIEVGFLGSGNQVVVSNGGAVLAANAILADGTISSNNLVLVTGAGSLWSNAFDCIVGDDGSGNRLLVSEGGIMRSSGMGRIGGALFSGSGNNLALITGSGSVWSNATDLQIGRSSGINNQLVVSNGASVFVGGNALLGMNSASNSVLVTDPGTSWLVGNTLYVGSNGALSHLVVTNGATVVASNLFVGLNASSTNNRVVVDGGTLRVANAKGASLLDIRRGTNVLNAGLVELDQLLVTNPVGSAFELNGGTLSAGKTTINNGQLFGVGNGVSPATFSLTKNGTHSFASGLLVANNARMTGNGAVTGSVTVQSGATLAPGASFGRIVFSNSLVLQGTVIMEISRNGTVLTNDQIQVGGPLTYGGALTVTNIGIFLPLAGNRFQLFPASSYSGSFSNITLPPVPIGLDWTNKLLVDGSIEVTGVLPPSVQTLPATGVTTNSAILNGAAVPNETNAIGWFEWGTTTNYGNLTEPQLLGGLTTSTNFSQIITGLTAGAAYHFRAVASNITAVVMGGDRSFNAAPVPSDFVTYLKASNPGDFDFFGNPVAVSDNTVVVGAGREDSNATGVNGNQNNESAVNSGAAYVFVRDGGTWIQQAYLKASNAQAFDLFGEDAVAISGDTIVVGAQLEASNATGVNGNQSNNSVANSGAAYVFVRNGTNWTQQAYLKASNTGTNDWFGSAVAISGDTVVVGAQNEDSNATGVNGDGSNNSSPDSGAAYVFIRNGTNWTQQAYLKAGNTGAGDLFGLAVSVSGDTVVVGAHFEDSDATGVNGDGANNSSTNSGAAYVFVRSGTNWSQQAYLKASNAEADDQFGHAVAVSSDTVVIGAAGESSSATGVNGNQNNNLAFQAGAAYVFVRSGISWSQQAYLKASNTDPADFFGSSVAVSGDTVVVAADGEDSNATGVNGNQSDNSVTNAGAAYLFLRSGTNWTQQAYLKASNPGAGDFFGYAVAVSGDTAVVAAPFEDSDATGVNGNSADNSLTNSGAAYVFDLRLITAPVISVASSGTSQITLSWTPPTPGFSLQETLTLSPVSWSNSPSGQTNPITLPATGQTKFFRLSKP